CSPHAAGWFGRRASISRSRRSPGLAAASAQSTLLASVLSPLFRGRFGGLRGASLLLAFQEVDAKRLLQPGLAALALSGLVRLAVSVAPLGHDPRFYRTRRACVRPGDG